MHVLGPLPIEQVCWLCRIAVQQPYGLPGEFQTLNVRGLTYNVSLAAAIIPKGWQSDLHLRDEERMASSKELF